MSGANLKPRILHTVFIVAVLAVCQTSYSAVNAEDATALIRKSECLKCHAVDKDKRAPSFRKIAEKWRGRADAETRLIDYLSKAPKVQQTDGQHAKHKTLATNDLNEIRNVIAWIQSQ